MFNSVLCSLLAVIFICFESFNNQYSCDLITIIVTEVTSQTSLASTSTISVTSVTCNEDVEDAVEEILLSHHVNANYESKTKAKSDSL